MRWLLTLIFITSGYLASLLVFQRGILLKRHIIVERSSCSDVVLRDSNSCWLPARFKRAIILVIDALRYDFVKSCPHDFSQECMPFTAALFNQSRQRSLKKVNAKLFRFISDSPTTTFQRIKALVTGNIPTFVEAGENFGASEIHEDNLIDEILGMGRNVTFLGDDTWIQILPNRFNRNFAWPSFDIKDLHTVDNLVIDKIYDEINRTDWNVLVSHVLGVDHCGHRYGLYHPEMRRKLHQMDELIHNITRTIDDDTLLMVMGDHGMTETGDHGGDSRPEVEAALIAYAKKGFDRFESEAGEVEQIDLVPTMSLLLGIPIPFSSVGRVIESLINPAQVDLALKLNAIQVTRYAQKYSNIDSSTAPLFLSITRRLENAPSDMDAALNRETIDGIKRVIRGIFQTNDMSMSLIGILAFTECLIFNAYAAYGLFDSGLTFDISWPQLIFRSALLLLQFSLYFDADMETQTRWRSDLLTFSAITLFASLVYTLALLCIRLFLRRTSTYLQQKKELIIGITLLIQPFTFGSNSFVVGEPAVLRFIFTLVLSVLLVCRLRENLRSSGRFLTQHKRANSLQYILGNFTNRRVCACFAAAFCAIRLSALFEICREENANCNVDSAQIVQWFTGQTVDVYSEAIQERIRTGRTFAAACALFLTNYFVVGQTRKSAIDGGRESDLASFGRSLSWPLCIGVVVHWMCEMIEKNMAAHGVVTEIVDKYATFGRFCAQAVYLASVLYFVIGIYILKSQKFNWNYTVFAMLRQVVAIVIAMILGDAPAIIFCTFHLMLVIIEPWIIENGALIHAAFLYLFGSSAFYALGHQCVFTAIPWNAAFVGLPGNFSFKAIAALLVFVHLFAGNIFAIFSIPPSSMDVVSPMEKQNDKLKVKTLLFLLFNGFRVLGSCVSCLFLWNNLMFFKIFAPKFVFEAVNLLVCSTLIVCLQFIIRR